MLDAYQPSHGDSHPYPNFNGIMAKFNNTGGLVFNTYLGGDVTENIFQLKTESNSNQPITGFSTSSKKVRRLN